MRSGGCSYILLLGAVSAGIWLSISAAAQACGIGQPFTMMADATAALSYPGGSASAAAPLGIFPQAVAAGAPVTFSELTPPTFDPTVYTWEWTFGDGAKGDGEQPAHVFRQAGIYVVRLVIQPLGQPAARAIALDSAALTVQSRAFSDPPIVRAHATAAYVAFGGTVQYDASASTDPRDLPLRYTWNFGDGQSADGAQVSHRFVQLGQGSVAVIVQDARGARTVVTFPITAVPELPVARITLPGTPIAGQPLRFAGTQSRATEAAGDTLVDYLWTFGDGQAWEGTSPTTLHRYAHPGRYLVILQVTDSQGLPGVTQATIIVGAPVPTSRQSGVLLWLLAAGAPGLVLLAALGISMWANRSGWSVAGCEKAIFRLFRLSVRRPPRNRFSQELPRPWSRRHSAQ
jgi:PKD repeat protein